MTTKKVTLGDLTHDPKNARSHNDRNIKMIADSLKESGAGRSVLVDENLRLIAGNGVVDAAAQVGLQNVIVVKSDGNSIIAVQRTDLTEEQKTRLALFDNRTAELSEWDPSVLSDFYDAGLLEGMFTPEEVAELLTPDEEEEKPGKGGDEFDETPREDQTRVEKGAVWRMGPHLLACRDAKVSGSYRDLFSKGETAALLVTDPPYGVSYDRARGDYKKEFENDDLRGEALRDFLRASFSAADGYLRPGAALYVFHGDGPYGTRLVFEQAFSDAGWHLSATIIWVKNVAGYGYADYRARHEPILYGWTDGAEHFFGGDHSQNTVWEVSRDPSSEYLHPTQKPIELIQRAIHNSSKPRDAILDPFCGGGPTLIAAHRLGRIARLMDKDPTYCDVVLRRAEAEGIEPIERL